MDEQCYRRIEKKAKELYLAYNTALTSLGSYEKCKTAKERDLWVNLVACRENLNLWIPEDWLQKNYSVDSNPKQDRIEV